MATKQRSITGLAVEFGRKAKRMTRDELAAQLQDKTGESWSYHAVARMEAGGRKVSAQELVALSEILGLPYGFLLDGRVGGADGQTVTLGTSAEPAVLASTAAG